MDVRFYLSSRTVTHQVLSALCSLTSVFGMGTGGPCTLMKRTILDRDWCWSASHCCFSYSLANIHSQSSCLRYYPKTCLISKYGELPHRIRYVRIYLSSRTVTHQVLSALRSLTSVFGMGTGGPCALIIRTNGAPSGIRTRDPLIKSQLLYQLS